MRLGHNHGFLFEFFEIMKQNLALRLFTTSLILALSACGETPASQAQAAPVAKQPAAVAAAPTPMKTGENVPAEVAKQIASTLEKNYADQKLKVLQVNTSPISGLYEVVMSGKQIAYSDASGKYMLVGDLIETTEGRSLTEERKVDLNRIDFNTLPLDKAIKEVRGNGALKVAVFTDADCPFCKRLEREFAKMNNVTIYNFMMPIASLHPDAHRKSVQIVCQPNPTQAWTAWMREGKLPPKIAECKNSVAETTALGESFGFNGTPTIVFPNGKVQAGYAPMPQLQTIIQQNQK